MRTALPLLTLALLTGCSDPDGIYLLWFETSDTVSCNDNVTENFKDGEVPDEEDDSEWVIDSETYGADSLAFAQIITTTSGDAVLVMDDAAYPGIVEAGIWTFSWTSERRSEDREEHEDGYRYTADTTSSTTTTIVWPGPGENAGTASFSTRDEESWTESDEWGDDVADIIGYYGQIPSTSYVFEDTEYGWSSIYNDGDEDDCESDTCELTVTTTCSYDSSFLVFETTYADEDTYTHLEDAGQI